MVICLIKNKGKTLSFCALFCALLVLPACTQSTPSMMNTSPIRLSHETVVEQIVLSDLNDTRLSLLTKNYHQYGNGAVDLTMTYDPKAKDYTAMKAVHTLKNVEETLKKKGIRQVYTQTMPIESGRPILMVSYNVARAHTPEDCGNMPGLYNNKTGRFIGDYKFGCGVDSLIAQQVARPSDLEGRSEMGLRDGRREAVVIDGYSAGVPREALDGIERSDLSSGDE